MKLKGSFFSAAALILFAASPGAHASLLFDLAWSGASFGNSATATGTIEIDDTLLNNPGDYFFVPMSPPVTALTVTVSGATSGNGTFSLAAGDFSDWIFDTSTVTVDLNSELVGQGGGLFTTFGDFNLFQSGSNPAAPNGTSANQLTTNNFSGDTMALTSFAPTAVPEAGESAIVLLGVTGLLAIRRRKRS